MKTKSLVWIIVFSCMLLIACTEEYDLNLHPETKLVIDAEITNGKPPYYTHLGLSGSLKSDLNQWVDDALIIISDDEGVVDTLIPAADSIWTHYTKYTTQSGEDSIVWYPVYDNMGAIDSMLIYDHRLATQCYFQTTKLQGKAGHTYYLKAEWRGHTYTAECTMPSAIKIDTITHRQADKFKDGAVGEIPYVWFHDNPNEDNYYVFKKGWQEEPLSYSNGQYTWSVSIISDELLQQGFKGMDLCGGVATESWRKDNWDFSLHPNGQKLMLYSVTKEVYDYYNSQINQIRYDGGVYTPSPASAPTNIKGGALGVFNVASFDYKYCIMSEEEYNEKYQW